MNKAYIASAKRTPLGSLLGSLRSIPASSLGSIVIKAILAESRIDPNIIQHVIMGQVITGGEGQNPARQASMLAGIPKETPSFTINKVCGSGLKAVCLAAASIKAGDSEIIIAGGQENMSLSKHAVYLRAGNKLGDLKMLDLMMQDGLVDVFSGSAMGVTAENIASQHNIKRSMQDEFALQSHQKAAYATINGYFKNEIVPVEIATKKQTSICAHDENIRSDTSLEVLSKLATVFKSDGTVTAGNSSSINDGAAGLLIVSEKALQKYGLNPLAKIVSYASCGVEPERMGTGPIPAVKKALAIAGWEIGELDLIEANEAFAAASLYVNQQLGWDVGKVNVNGGAIALGHPIGASGARILVTLTHQLQRQRAKKGLATLCIGGGMGIAMCVETV